MEARLIDLSHELVDGRTTYPGFPPAKVGAFLSREESRRHYAPGTEFLVTRMDFVTSSGTYIDAPYHRYDGKKDVADLGLAAVADRPGLVVRARERNGRAVGPDFFQNLDLAGRAVLVETGWSDLYGTPQYFEGHPFLTAAAAQALCRAGPALVGVDSLNIDDTSGGQRPVHSLLLDADILIVENLTNLAELPDAGFAFFAVPVKVRGCGSFPVRAFARIAD